jgi:hypothetical protein
MATKAQMKQRCKQLEEQLAEADELRRQAWQLIEQQADKLERTKESETQYYNWYQAEQQRQNFYWKCLSKIRHVLALDTVEQLTHRQRNEKLRTLVGTIAWWMDTTQYESKELDDIPF